MKEELQDIFYELARKGWGEDVDKIIQEIERLNKELAEANNIIKSGINEELRNENINLKLRINKAREYIKDHTTHYTSYLGREHKVVPKIELQREAYDKLLEILQGSDKE